jgi:hypothetical protein
VRKDEFVEPSRRCRQDLFAANGKGARTSRYLRRPFKIIFIQLFPFTLKYARTARSPESQSVLSNSAIHGSLDMISSSRWFAL